MASQIRTRVRNRENAMEGKMENGKVIRMPVTAETLRRAGRTAKEDARRAKARNRRMATVIVLLLLAAALVFFGSSMLGRAKGSSERTKKLASVYVENGDTIWDIATRYYTPECGDMKTYVREIESTNGLRSSKILYGYTLLVPYYD